MKIQNIKRIRLNSIGTVATVIVLCCISFTAGVDLTQNANSAGSSSALPVSKGGTGANNASGALTNLGAQEKLVSGTNIKSLNGTSLLGKGDIRLKTCVNIFSNLGVKAYMVFTAQFTIWQQLSIEISSDQGYWGHAVLAKSTNEYNLNPTKFYYSPSVLIDDLEVGISKSGPYAGKAIIYKASGDMHAFLVNYCTYTGADLTDGFTIVNETDEKWNTMDPKFVNRYLLDTTGPQAPVTPTPTETSSP
ncbi:MAG: hypothetical protein LBB07_00395 [Bifidobacteriaceae bacterium]|jgi:hypothetical protein|nr:hypothetical protein [Bifidobacteriaceae bacterium]